jgi:hypothetical protein
MRKHMLIFVMLSSTLKFFDAHRGVFAGSLLAGIATMFFLVIGFPDVFSGVQAFSQRWFGVTVVGLFVVVSFAVFARQEWGWGRVLSCWAQSNILFLFSSLYYIRINNSQLEFLSLRAGTAFVFLILSALIYLLVFTLIQNQNIPLYLHLAQTILIALTVFSLVYYIDADNTSERVLSYDWLTALFRLPTYLWVLTGSAAISGYSVLSLTISRWYEKLLIFFFFTVALLNVGILLNAMTIGYWAKTLIYTVCWDYIYNPIAQRIAIKNDRQFLVRFLISSVYHMALIGIIVLATSS